MGLVDDWRAARPHHSWVAFTDKDLDGVEQLHGYICETCHWQVIVWSRGSDGPMASFAAVRDQPCPGLRTRFVFPVK